MLETVGITGQRVVISTGWGGLRPENPPDDVHVVDGVPHDWLFPRVPAVVHHGGAGTTAAGLRAGKPSVICPFITDRFFWGRRVHDLGAGVGASTAEEAISGAPRGRHRLCCERCGGCGGVARLGDLIAREDGVAVAADYIVDRG